jgi:hypothetical protein
MTLRIQNPRDETRPQEGKAETPKPLGRKTFVEPAISNPVDVLEATTFFQAVDSGPTGRPRTGE